MNRLLLVLALLCSSLALAQHPASLKQRVAAGNPPTATDHAGQAITVASATATAGFIRLTPQASTGTCDSSVYGKLIVLSTDGYGRLCTAAGWLLVPMVFTNGAGTALDFGSLTTLTEATLTLTVTGAASGDRVSCATTAKLETGIIISNQWVSAPNTISITEFNGTAGTVDPASKTFVCDVFKR